MKLYSYVMVSDSGFAPNPSDGFCTLACCKPVIRRTVNVGDWLIGTGSKGTVGNDKLIYAMQISEKMGFNSYFQDNRFKNRLDNIYLKENGNWFQKKNKHHHKEDMEHNLSGKQVLISNHFYYFGKDAITIPKKFWEIIKTGPGHKCNFPVNLINDFIKWLEGNYALGKQDTPYNYIHRGCLVC